jgi:hypothetical protein
MLSLNQTNPKGRGTKTTSYFCVEIAARIFVEGAMPKFVFPLASIKPASYLYTWLDFFYYLASILLFSSR